MHFIQKHYCPYIPLLIICLLHATPLFSQFFSPSPSTTFSFKKDSEINNITKILTKICQYDIKIKGVHIFLQMKYEYNSQKSSSSLLSNVQHIITISCSLLFLLLLLSSLSSLPLCLFSHLPYLLSQERR